MISPPAGPLPGHCEAPATSHSYWQRARDAAASLTKRYGKTRARLSLLIALVLFMGAMIQLGDAARIIVKAHVAQLLIRQAWQQNLLAGDPDVKPWPWADMSPVARMTFERQQVALFVLDNDAPRTLAFGPGVYTRSVLPGRNGNTVISAHRDTHFAVLEHTVPGDIIQIQTIEGRELAYEVVAKRVVDKHDMWVAENRGRDELTLVTCWPFDALTPGGPERLIVSARPQQASENF